jgi:hypothetical protein
MDQPIYTLLANVHQEAPTPTYLAASQLVNLLEILYVLCIDYADNGAERRPDPETAEELRHLGASAVRQWGKDLPALRDSVNAALAGRNKAEQLAILGLNIKDKFQDFRQNTRFTSRELEILKALGAYLRTDSEPAFNKIKKFAGLINNPYISKRLAPKVGSQRKSGNELRRLVYEMVGRDDTALTLDEAKIAKESYPDVYKQYLAYRREHSRIWKEAAVSFVRNSGHNLVPYEELLDFLHVNGIDHMLPLGFTGQVDDLMRMYTNEGHLIDGVPNAVTFPSVEMNEDYGQADGGDFVFQALRGNGGPGPYFYTVDYKKAAARDKFARVSNLAPKIEGMQRKWFQMVKRFKPDNISCVCAVVLELLFEFSARIGSRGNNAGGKSTFGIATLLVKHLTVDPAGNVIIRYRGKDAVPAAHRLLKADPQQKFVIAALMQLMHGKQPNDRLMTVVKGNRMLLVGGGAVNTYFHSLGAQDVTVHKLRTYRGTTLFTQLMEQALSRPIKDEAKAMAIYKKMGEAVGKALNHVRRGANGSRVTGVTALANYIDPEVQIAFFTQLGFRPPKSLERYMMDEEQ